MGGKSFYAIDITDPDSMTTEAIVKDKVLWEFTDTTMGYSYGAPNVIKTKKYGWEVVLTSGYNNSYGYGYGYGYGYIYFVNPRNGALLESVRTPTASARLAQATAYIKDFTDGTADAIYAGDLDGQVWRFDVSATGSYPAPVKLATVTDGASNPQAITSQPLVEIDPKSRRRYVMFGTGQLLDSVDIKSGATQAFYAFVDGTANLGVEHGLELIHRPANHAPPVRARARCRAAVSRRSRRWPRPTRCRRCYLRHRSPTASRGMKGRGWM